METVLSALKAMGKATAIEIAARTGMDREQVVRDLWELKRSGVADRVGGAWKLLDDDSQADEPEEPAATAEPQPTEKIGEPEITAVLRLEGPKTAEELAARFGTTARKITSTLAMAVSRGRLQRVNQGGKFRYDLPAAETVPEPVPATPEPAVELVAVSESAPTEAVETPAAPAGFQMCAPDLREINREIRAKRQELARWIKMRRAVHAINRNEENLRRWASEIAEAQ